MHGVPTSRTLIIVAGRVGGVGTSTAAKALVEKVRQDGTPCLAYDAGGERGGLVRCYPDVTPVKARDARSLAPVIDTLVTAEPRTIAVVDAWAGAADQVDEWVRAYGPAEAARQSLIQILLVHVLSPRPQSIEALRETTKGWNAAQVPYKIGILKNNWRHAGFGLWDGSNTRADLQNSIVGEFDMPELDPQAAISTEMGRMSYADFSASTSAHGAQLSFSQRAATKFWLDATSTAFRSMLATITVDPAPPLPDPAAAAETSAPPLPS